MFDMIKGFTEQVMEYGTAIGQLWYVIVFLFRGMVVVTIGGDVYSDEQSEFKCSTDVVGCQNVCFANFSKISHIRFWAFQLLAVSTPTIFFHFFVISVKARIEKMKKLEKELLRDDCIDGRLSEEENSIGVSNSIIGARLSKFRREKVTQKLRTKPPRVHFKNVYDVNSSNLREVAFTDSIYLAYFMNVLFRAILEGLFLYLSYDLFKFLDVDRNFPGYGALDFVWFRVPPLYRCQGPNVLPACQQHLEYGTGGYVPCWVSRPWEKTIFLRYMNILSCLCFILSTLEFFYLIARGTRAAKRKQNKKRNAKASSQPPSYQEERYTLGVPIKLSRLHEFDDRKAPYR